LEFVAAPTQASKLSEMMQRERVLMKYHDILGNGRREREGKIERED
jgi:hypothetical protein